MEGLAKMGARGKHVNVLQHLMGFLKNHLSSSDNAYRWYIGAPGPHRGLPAGACTPVGIHHRTNTAEAAPPEVAAASAKARAVGVRP
jgi:hypothetical protein